MRAFFEFLKNKLGGRELVGVEVGVFDGSNAAEVLDGLPIKMLFLVDQWEPYDSHSSNGKVKRILGGKVYQDEIYAYVKRRFKARENITIVKEPSVKAAKMSLYPDRFDFVYIDADHLEKHVYEDCEAWYQLVKNGGFLGGHDFKNKVHMGVWKAVKRFAKVHDKLITAPLKSQDWWLI